MDSQSNTNLSPDPTIIVVGADDMMRSRRNARAHNNEDKSEQTSSQASSEKGFVIDMGSDKGVALTGGGGREGAELDLGMDLTGLFSAPVPSLNDFLQQRSMLPGSAPLNFGIVLPGVYRSSYPQAGDYAFIRGLGLKSMITLVDKEFPEGYKSFLFNSGIRHYVFSMKGTKKEDIPQETMKSILRVALNPMNHPLLIHCNHGKHRTGCIVAVMRKAAGWDLQKITDEYRAFAHPKERPCDILYISAFKIGSLQNLMVNSHLGVHTLLQALTVVMLVMMITIWYMVTNSN